MARERQRQRGSTDGKGEAPSPERAMTAIPVRFSAAELERLKADAEHAGVTVAVLVRTYALDQRRRLPHATIGSRNVASNPPSTPETSSGIRVRGYSGTYGPTIGKNR